MNQQQKKVTVLLALFVIPLVFYIFLSNGIYHYANLPILTDEVEDVSSFSSEKTEPISFADHFNVVCFFGNDIAKARLGLFNLNEIIYKRFQGNKWFRIVAVFPLGMEGEVQKIKEELNRYSNTTKWEFVFASSEAIKNLHQSFETRDALNANLYSNKAYIIDKKFRLRGRKDDEDTKDGKLYGYDMESIAVLKNKMKDDIGIVYYQYKKSAEKAQRRKV